MERKPSGSLPAVSQEQWHELAQGSLRQGAIADLRHRTGEGILLEVAYFPPPDSTSEAEFDRGDVDGSPGRSPFRRGAVLLPAHGGWDHRALISGGDPETVNTVALAELAGGANSLELVLSGLQIDSAPALNHALAEIYLDLAPISIDGGAQFSAAIEWLCEVWNRREHDPALVCGAWNVDPISLAVGARPDSGKHSGLASCLDENLQQAGLLAAEATRSWPKVTALRVGTSNFHGAGCSDAQELAVAMAAGVLYLRTMETAGVEVAKAFDQIVMAFSMDADLFAGIAKLRAARILWSQIAEGCGVELGRGLRIQTTSARRMMAHRETLTNALRVTTAAAAAVLGGADTVTTLPFDTALHGPGPGGSLRGARLARNTQVILRQESHLEHVLDPMGGSWYMESRTDALARAAWREFQAIEGNGGIVEDLRSGRLAGEIREVSGKRMQAVRDRSQVLVGVSEFARLDRETLEQAVHDDAEMGDVVLPQIALDQDYEHFRRASDRLFAEVGRRPRVWLANFGTLAQHNARTTFCRNLLAAGGIEAVHGSGGSGFVESGTAGGPCAESNVADVGRALSDWIASHNKGRALEVAILCSSDALYQLGITDVVADLESAGIKKVLLAGDPGVRRATYEQAGVRGFVHLGIDVIALFEKLYDALQVPADGPVGNGEGIAL